MARFYVLSVLLLIVAQGLAIPTAEERDDAPVYHCKHYIYIDRDQTWNWLTVAGANGVVSYSVQSIWRCNAGIDVAGYFLGQLWVMLLS